MTGLAILATILALLLVWLGFAVRRAAHRRTAARADYFSKVLPLFNRVVTRIEPTGFPRVTGHLGPHAFDLQALPDSLTFRKLPTLWVMVTLPEPMPVKATLDILARATGQEPFTRFSNLPVSLPCPAFLPEGSGVRSDDAGAVPSAQLLAPHAGLFADPSMKELLISPKGLRLVILGDEAERGRYLIFRDAEVGLTPLSAARLTPLLDSLLALRQDLINAKEVP